MLRRLVTLSTIALPWLLGACAGNGPCDHDPALCMLQGLTIDPKAMARSQLGAESTSTLTVTTSKAWPVFGQKLRGTLVSTDADKRRIQLDELTSPPSEYKPSIFAVRDQLPPGTYTFKIAHPARDLELADGQPDPTLTITDGPVALTWKEPSTLPLNYPGSADLMKGPVSVRGVWIGRPNGMNLVEVLLLRDYTNNSAVSKTQVSQGVTDPKTWPSITDVQDAPSFFGLWPFGSPNNPLAAYLTKGSSHFVSSAPLAEGTNPNSTDLEVAASAMAIAVRKDGSGKEQVGLLVQTSSGLKGYVLHPGPPKAQSTALMKSCTPKYLVGYADDSAGANGVGVLGMNGTGQPCFFDFDGTQFTENTNKVATRGQEFQKAKGPITALAVGDVNDDGRNDIAIARANKIEFYVNQWWGFVPAEKSLALTTGVEPAAIAIGQMDGVGKNDLLVADGVKRMCGTPATPCNHVYVYLHNPQ